MSYEIIVTRELMEAIGACNTGPDFFTEQNLWGQPEDIVVNAMRQAGMQKEEDWWFEQKKTEKFVRYFGSQLTMSDVYQVFNPETGQHEQCSSRELAVQKMTEIAQLILNKHRITVVQELRNEHGDTAWVASDLSTEVTVKINQGVPQ